MLKLQNKDKKILPIKKSKNILEKGIGLMFSKEKNFNYALVFDMERESKFFSSIHMFFVFFPICLLFLDSKKKIVDIQIAKPWKVYFPKKKARYVIEVPLRYKKEFKKGDLLVF